MVISEKIFPVLCFLLCTLASCTRQEQASVSMSESTPVLKSGFSFSEDSDLSAGDIVSSAMPYYPQRAWEVLGKVITTKLEFKVDSLGNVLPGIVVTKSTGYPDWDKEVKKSLSKWKFKPSSDIETRAGTINFRFVIPQVLR